MSWYLLLILRFKTEIALVEERKKRCLTFAVSYCCVPASWDILEVPSSYLKAKCKYHSTDTRLPNQTVPACSVNPCSGVYLNAISQSTFAFSPDMGRLWVLHFELGCCQGCGKGEENSWSCIYIPWKGFEKGGFDMFALITILWTALKCK